MHRACRRGFERTSPRNRSQNETSGCHNATVSPYRWVGTDLELSVHAQPGARRTGAQGMHGEAIKVRISAPAVEGAANRALLEFLAEAFQVPRGRCEVLSGETARRKRVRVAAPDRVHAERVLARWTQTSS
jgi:uncharacterized protein (TIGR00251 family)